MQHGAKTEDIFDEQMERIKLITGKKTQVELAELLGIKQSSISDAKRRGSIPANWLIMLIRLNFANPEWILTGDGPLFVSFSTIKPLYKTEDERADYKAKEKLLRQLPSKMLADELVRRISVS